VIFNEVFAIQFILLLLTYLFIFSTNLLVIWYVAGLLLVVLGFLMLLDNNDIFIGFLWLIDLGVGLVFLIFIFHFSNFLYKKISVRVNFFKKLILGLILSLFILILLYVNQYSHSSKNELFQIKQFLITWYDYFLIFNNYHKTDLNLLRELYFFNNSWEFILINFLVLYGIFTSIVFFFILKKIFTNINFASYRNINILNLNTSFLYIRNQNLINQQDEGASLKVWIKRGNDSEKNFFKNVR